MGCHYVKRTIKHATMKAFEDFHTKLDAKDGERTFTKLI